MTRRQRIRAALIYRRHSITRHVRWWPGTGWVAEVQWKTARYADLPPVDFSAIGSERIREFADKMERWIIQAMGVDLGREIPTIDLVELEKRILAAIDNTTNEPRKIGKAPELGMPYGSPTGRRPSSPEFQRWPFCGGTLYRKN